MFKNYPVFFLSPGLKLFFAVALIWTIVWKAIALWKAARNNHIAWYIVLLIVNTLGILEIIYIFGFSKKSSSNTSQQILH